MIEYLYDAVYDGLPMIPLLFLTYIVLEYIEHKNISTTSKLTKYKKFGPLIGAFIGIIPQCGFSVAAASLFIGNTISFGTLVAVFIATSDEAIPILISYPEQFPALITTVLLKIVIAVLAGYFIDILYKPKVNKVVKAQDEHTHHHSIFVEALQRTVKITVFVFLVNILLNVIIGNIGEERLHSILLTGTIFQPMITAIVGFIPNCAATVVITQLFVSGGISFGSLIAGLITNAGLGLLVLIRAKNLRKPLGVLIVYLYIIAVVCGMIIQLIF